MLSYCLNCRKNIESKNPKVVKTKNERTMPLLKSAVCNSKNSKIFKEHETKGLLDKLTGIKIPILSDLPIAKMMF